MPIEITFLRLTELLLGARGLILLATKQFEESSAPGQSWPHDAGPAPRTATRFAHYARVEDIKREHLRRVDDNFDRAERHNVNSYIIKPIVEKVGWQRTDGAIEAGFVRLPEPVVVGGVGVGRVRSA